MKHEPWRAAALIHLPNLRPIVTTAKSQIDLWQSLKEYIVDHPKSASPIFEFAWWCFMVDEGLSFRYEVEAFFYEDLPLFCDLRPLLLDFVSQSQFQKLSKSLSTRLSSDEFAQLQSDFYKHKGRHP